MADLLKGYRAWIGLVAVTSVVWLASLGVFGVVAWANRQVTFWRIHRQGLQLLQSLTPVEKGYLKEYIDADTVARTFRFSDGVAQALKAKRILQLGSTLGRYYEYFDFILEPWARRVLKAHPELLEGAIARQDDDDN